MTLLASVLYEDGLAPGSKTFPLHELVMRLVEDDINGATWQLLAAVTANPRKGIDRIIADIGRLEHLGTSGKFLLLVDLDRVAQHLGLDRTASETEVVEALVARSDCPERLEVFFLRPNMEGLLGDIQKCMPSMAPAAMRGALAKKTNERDVVLREAKKASLLDLRCCIRTHQPGLDALAKAIAALLAPMSAPAPA